MLREFATPKPKNIWFIHPRHLTDEEQLLDDCSPDSTQPSWKAHKKEKAPRVDKMHSFKVLLDYNPNEEWTVEKAAEQMSVSVKSVRRYCQTLGWSIEKGKIVRASKEEKQDDCPF
jgi:response regulator of citrate/malate metabolism